MDSDFCYIKVKFLNLLLKINDSDDSISVEVEHVVGNLPLEDYSSESAQEYVIDSDVHTTSENENQGRTKVRTVINQASIASTLNRGVYRKNIWEAGYPQIAWLK